MPIQIGLETYFSFKGGDFPPPFGHMPDKDK